MNALEKIDALPGLPHGDGFRFLHELVKLNPGVSAHGRYRVPLQSSILDGHFPGDPMMPGVLILEAGAQLAGILSQSEEGSNSKGPLKLAAVRMVKFPGTAYPGELIDLKAEVTVRLGGLTQAKVRATVGERVVMEGEVVLGS